MDAIEHVTDAVVRIPLPLPLVDLHTVNAYAVVGARGITLVDPGWASDDTEFALLAGLRALDAGPDDVERILVTHSHWDHYTQAVDWQRRHGTEILLGRGERHTLEAFGTLDGVYPEQVAMLRRAGAPERADVIAAVELEPHEGDVPFGLPDTWLDGGEEIDCGGRVVRAIATPGHTRGHVVFEDVTDGLLMTGDHILPRITPSVAFERAPEALALRSYLGSLQLFLDRSDATMLPAHGDVVASVHQRARELLTHHEERLSVVEGLVVDGATTAAEVAGRMRWTRREKTLEELGDIHGMTAVLEASVHLELLAWQGRLTRHHDDAVDRYAA